jgi:hypothetical protein
MDKILKIGFPNRYCLLRAIFCLLAIFFSEKSFCSESGGGYAGAFLRLGMGVRALSMGSAFTAVSNDVTATYWNPAGLGQISNYELFGMFSMMSMNRRQSSVALAIPMQRIGTFGLNWINLNIADIMGRDLNGEKTSIIKNSENCFTVSYGRSINRILYLGGSLKYLTSYLYENSANGYGYDLGALIRINSYLYFGATIQDIHSRLKWDTASKIEERIIPRTKYGLAFRPPENPFIISLDLEDNEKDRPEWHLGGEITLLKSIGIDIGYYDKTISGGVLLSLPVSEKNSVEIQYSLNDNRIDLPVDHRLSVIYKMHSRKVIDRLERSDYTSRTKREGNVIKVVSGKYGLIDLGQDDYIQNGMILKIYRKNKYVIGEVQVIELKKDCSAIKVVTLLSGYQINVGDKVMAKQ